MGFQEVRPLSYWNSHKWKPSQSVFIKAIRMILFEKLDKALANGQISGYQKDLVLNEILTNITKEISSLNRSYLTGVLSLADEEIDGIKAILYNDLRNHYEEKIKDLKKQLVPSISNVSMTL